MKIQSKTASPNVESELSILIGIDNNEAELEIKESDIINTIKRSQILKNQKRKIEEK